MARRFRLEMLLDTVRRADACSVLSEAAASPFRRFLLRDPLILPGGVDMKSFSSPANRSDVPTAFCASSLGDPRKRSDLLFAAWRHVLEQIPGARLVLASTVDPFMSTSQVRIPEGIEELDKAATVADGFAEAWVTVNAAPGEAFGLVLLESLASRTPIVCDDSGAGPEIVRGRASGSIFATGDEESLANALIDSLRGPPSDQLERDCFETADEYDWSRVVERYEDVYTDLAC